jgi:hypothetical protein
MKYGDLSDIRTIDLQSKSVIFQLNVLEALQELFYSTETCSETDAQYNDHIQIPQREKRYRKYCYVYKGL